MRMSAWECQHENVCMRTSYSIKPCLTKLQEVIFRLILHTRAQLFRGLITLSPDKSLSGGYVLMK